MSHSPDNVRQIGTHTFRDTQPAPQPREARTEPRTEPVWVQRMRRGENRPKELTRVA